MTYVIEVGIPLPPSTRKGGNYIGPQSDWTKAVNALEPGESVLTPLHHEFKAAEQLIQRNRPKRYAIRKIPNQGWRVWRLPE